MPPNMDLAALFLFVAYMVYRGSGNINRSNHELEFWCKLERDKEVMTFISSGDNNKEPLPERRKKRALRNKRLGYFYTVLPILLFIFYIWWRPW